MTTPNSPYSSYPLLAYTAEQTSYGMISPCGHFGSAAWVMSLPKTLSSLACLLVRGECWRDRPDVVERRSRVDKT